MTVDFDEALGQAGGFGRYQILLLLVSLLADGLFGMNNIAYVFLAYEPKYECSANKLYSNLTSDPTHGNLSIINGIGSPIDIDPCTVRSAQNLSLTSGQYSHEGQNGGRCTEWTYDQTTVTKSIVMEVQ